MPAVLFGSISTIADTSELQRRAFNDAFERHELGWTWDRDTYRSMLDRNGGVQRIAAYAEARGEEVDAVAVHATKSVRFRQLLAAGGIVARPGVIETLVAARERGVTVAVASTTSAANVGGLLAALGGALPDDGFDVVLDVEQVDAVKPSPDAYRLALARLGEDAGACIAIEDNPGGLAAATAAGVRCLAFPNANTGHLDFSAAVARVDRLDPAVVLGHLEVDA